MSLHKLRNNTFEDPTIGLAFLRLMKPLGLIIISSIKWWD